MRKEELKNDEDETPTADNGYYNKFVVIFLFPIREFFFHPHVVVFVFVLILRPSYKMFKCGFLIKI